MEIGSKWGNRQIVEDFSYRAHNSQKIAKVLDTQADDARYLRAMAIARQDTSNEEHRYKDQMKKNIKNAKDEARVEALHILHEKAKTNIELEKVTTQRLLLEREDKRKIAAQARWDKLYNIHSAPFVARQLLKVSRSRFVRVFCVIYINV